MARQPASGTLPTGVVTFLFTDIEGSTRLVQNLGEPTYRQVLSEHCRIVRDAIVAHDGTEVSTEGDSFFAVFRNAADGIAATLAAQRALTSRRWPGDADVRVRMGLHTGAAALGGDNYLGLDVHRAARVAAAGHGGQVVVSGPTKASLEGALPASAELIDLGAHRLKDLNAPEHLYQLVAPGLQSEFPAIRSVDAQPNNLPAQMTSFVGREREMQAIDEALGAARLVTLTGPGGTGKTRLALEVARGRLGQHGDGVFFVELAPITDSSLVPSATATALRLREGADRSAAELIGEWLRDRDLLLVLDNLEQVLDAAPFIASLLAGAPRLRVLATSRAPLRLQGERELAVPPLGVPDAAHLPRIDQLSQYEGVALFVERARAVRPGITLDEGSWPAVAEIVARVDGLPLAIELAAAKVRVLSPEAIVGRLGKRLEFLGGGSRDLPARQQTLRATIDWSYRLLGAGDQAGLRRLGVFAGGFTLPAAERVLAAVGPGTLLDHVVELVASLVEQSLLRQADDESGELRFSMLESIREFAVDRLAAEGERDEARRAHALHFLAMAERLEPALASSPDAADAIERDFDNHRAALEWALEAGEPEIALRLGYALWRFWQRHGHYREGRSWFDRILAMPGGDAPTAARARGLTGAAGIAYWQNDYAAAVRWYAEAEDIVRGLGDRAWLADAMYNLGETAALIGDLETTNAKLAEGTAIARELADDVLLSRFLQGAGYMAFMVDDLETARSELEEALQIAERGTDPVARGIAHHAVGQVARLQERYEDAARHYREAMRAGAAINDAAQLTEPLQGLAAVMILTGRPELGVRWLGASTAIRERLGGGPPPEWLRLGDPLSVARGALEEDTFDRAWRSGLELTSEDAVAEAIG